MMIKTSNLVIAHVSAIYRYSKHFILKKLQWKIPKTLDFSKVFGKFSFENETKEQIYNYIL